MRYLLCLLIFGLIGVPASAQNSEKQAVLAVTQQIFDGINHKDGELVRAAMMPDAVTYFTSEQNGIARTGLSTVDDFATQVSEPPADFHERMFETTVLIQEGVALV